MSTTACEQTTEYEEWLDIALWQCRRAITAEYSNVSGRIDIRWLWSCNGVHYFRVNWWELCRGGLGQRIWRSAFVSVAPTDSDLLVYEQTATLAA